MPLSVEIPISFLVGKEEQHYKKQEAKKEKLLIRGIEIQSFVVETPIESWQKLFEYYEDLKAEKSLKISENHFDLLRKMASGILTVPSEKQALVLYNLYNEARNSAYVI